MDDIARFLELLRAKDGVEEEARQTLVTFRRNEAAMEKDNNKSNSDSNEPWKAPQSPFQKPPPKRDPETDYEGDKAQTS